MAGDDDQGLSGPPPPRGERRWVHPSELAAAASPMPLAPAVVRRRLPALPRVRGRAGSGSSALVVVSLASSLLGAAIALAGAAAFGAFDAARPQRIVEGVTPGVVGDLTDTETVARLVDAVTPTVVGINIETADGARRGSGITIRANGLVATSEALVQGASSIEVSDWRGRVHTATIVGADRASGVALVDVDADFLPVAPLAFEGPTRLGEMAITIGAPGRAQVSGSASLSVVSSLGRSVALDEATTIVGLVELDQALPSNSLGGAVLDRSGAVVAMALPSPVGAFAVPADVVRFAVGGLLADGEVAWPWLGVEQGTDLDAAEAAAEGVPSGAVVGEVAPGSSADLAGLRTGDVIVRVDGQAVRGINDLVARIREHAVGSSVVLTVSRDGARFARAVQLEERPAGR